MIDSSIDKLFEAINNSLEYKEYLSITKELSSNKEVMDLISNIKDLEKKATNLEYKGDLKYKEIDREIEEKTKLLNSNSYYIEYLSKLKKFNSTLSASSTLLEEYLNDKVSI